MKLQLLFIIFSVQFGISQDFLVSGQVISGSKPLEGASIIIKGSNKGVTTNADGYFKLIFSKIKNPKLVISHIGNKSRIIPIPLINSEL